MVHFEKDEIKNTQVITIIGSTRFEEEMKDTAEKVQSYGALSLVTSVGKEPNYTMNENLLMKEGYKRLSLSDFVICLNKDGYIGENTAREYFYATFVERIPVYFSHDKVCEKMLKYLNVFVVYGDGSYHLWNYDIIEGGHNIRKIYIRNTAKYSNDIVGLIDVTDPDWLSSMISMDLRKQVKRTDCPIVMLEDDVFDSFVKESKLFVNYDPDIYE